MTAPASLSGPTMAALAPRRGDEWMTFTRGMIVRCPGTTTTNSGQRVCDRGMGEVQVGYRVRVRVVRSTPDPDTGIVARCRRCGTKIEIQTLESS